MLAGVFFYLKYEYALFDSLLFLFGFIIPILTMLAYIEYTYLWIIQGVVGLFLNVQMAMNDISQITYLIYGVYALYCVILAFINVHKFYKEQAELKLPDRPLVMVTQKTYCAWSKAVSQSPGPGQAVEERP